MRTIYMDNAATSFPKPEEVYEAVDSFNRRIGGNPGRGSHFHTLQAGSILVDCRDELADLFGIADSSYIAFTLNITEAINTALKGILRRGDHVITSSMEHNAIARPLFYLERYGGIEWTAVPCAGDGSLDPDEITKAIRPNTKMICMLHVSNLTGTIMPIEEVGKIARNYGLVFVADTAQSAGILPINVEKQYIDVLAFTGHKSLMGPQGTGGIYIRPQLNIVPLKQGGTGSLSEDLEHPVFMPDMLESGTHNTPGIAGLLAGVRYIKATGRDNIYRHEQKLGELLTVGLKEIPGLTLYGPADTGHKTAVAAFNIKDMDCGEVSTVLSYEYGIVTRSGLHCAPLAHRNTGTFNTGACRLSPGFFNTAEDVTRVLRAIETISRGHY